ncbi:hypothetical protein F4824DRAFT_508931 [Ustulina deusta]|nr:hypothetical protein F4824DRAFT_508931 [Ustulina deusta]
MALVNNTLDPFSEFVKGIPVLVPLPPGEGRVDPVPPSLWDMGEDDLAGSEYVNAETDAIPPGHEDRVKYLQNVMLLSQKYLDLWGGINAREQIDKGNLKDDMSNDSQMKRRESVYKKFDVKRTEFHLTLMKAILEGIVGINSMTAALEKVLKSITDMVIQTGHYSENHTLWSFFNVCQWDPQAKDVKASLRFVTFKVTADIVNVVTGKSSMETVRMELTYFQTEVSLIESEWDYYKDKVQDFLREMGDKSIRDPTDGGEIPVD